MHLTHRIAAGLVAGSMLFGGAAGVMAAGNGKAVKAIAAPRVGVAYGQVSNLLATGFTLTRTVKSRTTGTTTQVQTQVTIIATTKEQARRGTTGALANGDYALVAGVKTKGAVTATRVLYSIKPFRHALTHRVAGSVVTSSATSLTIQTRAGATYTFTINAQTKFRVNKVTQTAAPTFTTGERVIVVFIRAKATGTTGTTTSAATLVARGIIVPAAKTASP
jgi:hypothetical protein